MSESQNEVVNETVVAESAEASFGDILDNAQAPSGESAELPDGNAVPEAVAPASEQLTETEPNVEPGVNPEATLAPAEKPQVPAETPKPQPQVPVSVLVSMREKAKAAEQRARDLEAQLQGQYVPSVDADSAVAELRQQLAQQRSQLLEQSEILTRQAHPDYDDVVKEFYEAAATNDSLAETVLNSAAPALAAYNAGQNLRLAKKYGPDVLGNPTKLRAAIESEVRADEAKKQEARFASLLTAKAAERANTPTDIAGVRAQGGGTQPYSLPSFAAVLRDAQKR